MKKYKTGVVVGKFLPPQIGHAMLITVAADACERLFVVLAERPANTITFCTQSGLPILPATLRLEWLKAHFEANKNVHFLYMDESEVPPYPHGTQQWATRLKGLITRNTAINTKIDAKFFGEESYFDMMQYFPDTEAVLVKRGMQTPAISATQIRSNPTKFFDYLIPPARDYFEKIIKKR